MPWAVRTGSEMALYNLICYAADKGFEMAVACWTEGELLKELPSNVPVFVYEKWSWVRRAYAGVYRRLSREEDKFITSVHGKFKPDLWYVNTITQPDIVRQAERRGVPCVLHVHELEQMLAKLSEADASTLATSPRLVIAASETARDVFQVLGRRSDMEVCYATINPARIKSDPKSAREIRKNLGIADDTFLWGMAGTLDPNKNGVRFIEIAAEMLRSGLDVHFMWLGRMGDGYSLYCREKARALRIEKKVSFPGARDEDYYDYLNTLDGLVVTSYKESFSIVTVEAAYLGKPVVAFDCGGVREIIHEGMGTIVNSWNNSDMIEAMVAVMKGEIAFDPRRSAKRAREFYVETQGERWMNLMRQYFARAEDRTLQAQPAIKR